MITSNSLQSVAQTRRHFQNVQLGLPDDDVILREEYEIPPEQRVRRDDAGTMGRGSPARGSPARGSPARSAKGKGREGEKGKGREVSMGL